MQQLKIGQHQLSNVCMWWVLGNINKDPMVWNVADWGSDGLVVQNKSENHSECHGLEMLPQSLSLRLPLRELKV
eukprot:scaffold232585_cov77-Attheya_sp.AAC.2